MYRNLGNKLKVIAKVFRWVLFAAMEAAGLYMLFFDAPQTNQALIATCIMALAPLVAWISSLPFYAIGHMVENSDIRTDLAIRQYAAMRAAAPKAAAPAQEAPAQETPAQEAPAQEAPAQEPPAREVPRYSTQQQQGAQTQQGTSRPTGYWGQY